MEFSAAFSAPVVPVQEISDPLLAGTGVRLSVLRVDLVHPVISGNKWFKLKHNLIEARKQGKHTLLSFGGPWSNHLHALAEAGRCFGFKTIGLVRGELPVPLNSCLQDAVNAGMRLEGISRDSFRHKHESEFLNQLKSRFGDFYLIPEGGANREGALGCSEIVSLYDQRKYDQVCMACGTGTMLAGMASKSRLPLLGFQALKGKHYLNHLVSQQLQQYGLSPASDWSINEQFHFGGFARTTPELMGFLTEFETKHDIPLEPVYSAKMLFGIYTLAKKRDFFPQNWSILAIHGGGLQGRRGFI